MFAQLECEMQSSQVDQKLDSSDQKLDSSEQKFELRLKFTLPEIHAAWNVVLNIDEAIQI